MSLQPGQMLSHYRLVQKIGEGGMGVVWKADDTVLGRSVAIKILPPLLAEDKQRLARFRREARLLAALNHPNVAAIHGFESSDDVHFLVLELIEGRTLAQMTRSGPLSVQETLHICRQVAEGLGAAHDAGVIHRDLKPGNVIVTPGGKVKVLDFGLARASATAESGPPSDLSGSPTVTASSTALGVVMGTAPYMSPEQARGKKTDKRTDIWAFGCVFYECLTGRMAFGGETRSDAVAAILGASPDWGAFPPDIPRRIRDLIRRCLQKDPERRLHDIADARIEIEELIEGQGSDEPAARTAISPRRPWHGLVWTLLGAILGAAAITAWNGLGSGGRPGSGGSRERARHLTLQLPDGRSLAVGASPVLGSPRPALAISRDGNRIVYTVEVDGSSQLYLHDLRRARAEPIAGTEGGYDPFFSPDGDWLGFFAGGSLKKIHVESGEPVTLCEARNPYGGSWGSDGMIYFTSGDGRLFARIPAGGGERESLKTHGEFSWPQFLHEGSGVLLGERGIGVRIFRDYMLHDVLPGSQMARYSETGHLLTVNKSTLIATPFDPVLMQVTGPGVPILEGIRSEGVRGVAHFAVAGDGTLVYVAGGSGTEKRLVWVDLDGRETPLDDRVRDYRSLRFAPDGRRVAVEVVETAPDIWVYDIPRDAWTRLTFDGEGSRPIWSPDGEKITFNCNATGAAICTINADGSGRIERIPAAFRGHVASLADEHLQGAPSAWSPDGTVLAIESFRLPEGQDILLAKPGSGEQPVRLTDSVFAEWGAAYSPDGRWIAYNSDESGRYEVYVRPSAGSGGKRQVSTDGGEEPVWSPRGDQIFYRSGDRWYAVGVSEDDHLALGSPRPLFAGPYFNGRVSTYDIHPDGRRFLVIKSELGPAYRHLNIVLNLDEEIRRKLSEAR